MPDNQTKKDKKYKFTPLEKRFIKIYLLLAVFYSIVSVYLLNTPIDEWVFNLGNITINYCSGFQEHNIGLISR
ncbi:hypothetical protein BSPWISOXPB_746 [uncultured Gammaproteobacteria bacterium]|nr:hypothetical protein BSPWISOXPB_746 [uncultured Gammaproteobacteria bacterium]